MERDRAPGGRPTALVVGAGPVGLMAACELIRHGVSCRIVDPKAGPTDESRAMALHARSLEILDVLGEAERFLARGRPLRGMALHRPDGGAIASVDVAATLRALGTPFPMILALPQGQTERLLLDRLTRLGGRVDWGTRLDGLAQDADGVTAALVPGSGPPEALRTSWLIGCDGAHSAVRHALGLAFVGAAYEEMFFLADLTLDWEIADDLGHILLLPDGPVLALPFPERRRWRLVALSGPAVAPGLEAAAAYFQRLLRRGGFPEVAVTEPTWASAFRIHRRVTDRFRVGRCFIAGDAAHIHSPAGGQGMNTGLQDAVNLAWKLGMVVAGRAPESLLDSYEAERRPVVADVLERTDRITRLITLRNPLATAARNALLGVAAGLGFVRRQAAIGLSQIGVNYQESPIVAEDAPCHAPGPRAGDRAPDVPLKPIEGQVGPSRLYELFRGGGHVLLLFPGATGNDELARTAGIDPGRITPWVVDRGDPSGAPLIPGVARLHDPDGQVHGAYGAGDGACLYLIRPDAYVAYRATPPDQNHLAAYLDRVLGTAGKAR